MAVLISSPQRETRSNNNNNNNNSSNNNQAGRRIFPAIRISLSLSVFHSLIPASNDKNNVKSISTVENIKLYFL